MPPGGQNVSCGSGAATALSQAMPPEGSAGKNFRVLKPRSASAIASDTVGAPGSAGTGASANAAPSCAVVPGLTRTLAPAVTAAATSATRVTVPTPTMHCGTSATIALT